LYAAGRPYWANFRPMGDCLFCAVTWKLQKHPTFLGYFIPRLSFWINFDKKWVGLHLGWFFHKLIWSPWYPVMLY
jgi:hypothetical protein